MSNPFSDFAKEAVPYARRRKLEKQAKTKVLTPQEKKQADQEKLHELWLADFAKRKKALIDSQYGAQAMALCAKLEDLRIEDGDLLIEMTRVWQPADRNTRFLVLHLIDSAMTELRERYLLSPFDDPIFDEPPNAFLLIRDILS